METKTLFLHQNFTKSIFFWIGLALLLLGSGPLLLIIILINLGMISDPHFNPILFGILARKTILPSMAITLLGTTEVLWIENQSKVRKRIYQIAVSLIVVYVLFKLLFICNLFFFSFLGVQP